MWLITTQGFYSAVEHREDPERLIVRARTREDIEALADISKVDQAPIMEGRRMTIMVTPDKKKSD